MNEKTKVLKLEDVIETIHSLPNAPNGYSDSYDKATILNAIEKIKIHKVELNEKPIFEWKFTVSHFYTNYQYADSTICYQKTYEDNKKAYEEAKKYIEENNIDCYLIRIYRRTKFSNNKWQFFSCHDKKD